VVGDQAVPQFKYQVAVEVFDEVLGEYENGPFVTGPSISAADIYWAPFIERFVAHVPMLYEDPDLRSDEFEYLENWFDSMDRLVPCYPCRVKGRVETWRKLLAETHPSLPLRDNVRPVPDLPTKSYDANEVWTRYAKDRPYVAKTPAEEVAACIVRNHEVIIKGAAEACRLLDEDADAAAREICFALLSDGTKPKLSAEALDVLSYLDSGPEGLAVPGDLGVIPAEALRSLIGRT